MLSVGLECLTVSEVALKYMVIPFNTLFGLFPHSFS